MLQKIILRNEIKEIILDHILSNALKAGERISLPALASQLSVSVTPVREALTQLTETGIVNYIANRGFFVHEISHEEAIEAYELMALLEGEALRKSSISASQLTELQSINTDFKQAKTPKEQLHQDQVFHRKLIENYLNTSAHKIIEDLRVRLTLYDFKFWDEGSGAESAAMHDQIIAHLATQQSAAAVKLLRENWLVGVHHITKSQNLST